MFNRKYFSLLTICLILLSLNVYSQIVLQGVITDNGAEYLGNGAEPVVNALVTIIDQADTTRSFSGYTNEQGEYSIVIWATGVNDNNSNNPGRFNLQQNYPNPFNPSTVIGYELTKPANISIEIFDVLGRKIKTLFDGFQSNRAGQVVWDATNDLGQGVPAGVYVYSLKAEGGRINKKMLLIDGHRGSSNSSMSQSKGTNVSIQAVLGKQMSDQYLLQVKGEDIITHEQQNLEIAGNMTLDITVTRTVTDVDGNVYPTVKIGDHWYMAENLRVTHFRNGDPIPNVTDPTEWSYLTTGAYCNYDNDVYYVDNYGSLYNWYAVNDSRKIEPIGWHGLTDEEWKSLEMVLGMSQSDADNTGFRGTNEGSKLAGNASLWQSGALENSAAFGVSGFFALPGGYVQSDGVSVNIRATAGFWTTTVSHSPGEAYKRGIGIAFGAVERTYAIKRCGFSFRLVRDTGPPVTLNSIEIEPSTATLKNSETQQFTCTATYSDQSTKNATAAATWSISPGTAGSINYIGNFTAHSSNTGTETVTATYQGKQDQTTVNVESSAVLTSIEVNPSSATLYNSETQQFTCTAINSDQSTQDVTASATWSVSPSTAGSIDDNGLFTAHATSTGVETVTATYQGQTGQATVNVFETGTVTDYDGNVYLTEKIGDRWWMAENLRVTHFRNGDPIPIVTDPTEWSNLHTGACCAYGNDENNLDTYGRLYNFFAVDDSRILPPLGWHVATDEDFKSTEMYLGMSQSEADDIGFRGTNEGSKLAGNPSLWESGALENNAAFGESGFSALPGGYRYPDGVFYDLGSDAGFWSSTENTSGDAWYRELYYASSDVLRSSYSKLLGFSVRFVRDTGPPVTLNSIEIEPSTATLKNSETQQFTCTATFSDQSTQDVTASATWSVSPGTAGSIDANGLFTAHATSTGVETVTATYQSQTGQATVNVFETGTVTDIDGNVYPTVKIGDQWWMMENLKVTHYRNGDPIPNVTDAPEWTNLTTGAYCNYDNDVNNVDTYGRLYNWYAVNDSRNIAPDGWHVATDEEWKSLEMFLGMSQSDADNTGYRGTDEGSKLAGNASLWNSGVLVNNAAFGESGFSALPGGYRSFAGYFGSLGLDANFWSSTEGSVGKWGRILSHNRSDVDRDGCMTGSGFSVRLVRDN